MDGFEDAVEASAWRLQASLQARPGHDHHPDG
jgi:hypothetical protein